MSATTIAYVTTGSSSSRGRSPDRIHMVKLERNGKEVVVQIGMREHHAEELARKLNELLA